MNRNTLQLWTTAGPNSQSKADMDTGIKHLRKVAQAAREFMKAADIGPDIAPVAYNEAREKLATSLGKLAEVEPIEDHNRFPKGRW